MARFSDIETLSQRVHVKSIFLSSFTGNLRIININIAGMYVYYWNPLMKVILGKIKLI